MIREAQPVDASAWVGLRHRLWPHHSLAELAVAVNAFFSAGTPLVAVAFLAWDGDRAVGFVEASVRPYVPGAHSLPAPHVEGWYVDDEARRQGVGRLLIAAVETWARRHGYSQLGSDALLENTDSAAAHRALGFREVERVRFFIKEVNGKAAGKGAG